MEIRGRMLFLILFLSIMSVNSQECMSSLDSNFDLNKDVKRGLSYFSSDIQESMREIMFFFDISVEYYLVDGADGVCHVYSENDAVVEARVYVGSDFINKNTNNPLFIEATLAHEAAHTMQYIYGKSNKLTGMKKELQADMIAGYYLSTIVKKNNYQFLKRNYKTRYNELIKQYIDQGINFGPSVEENLYTEFLIEFSLNYGEQFSDYKFSNTDHHGRPKQRSKALAIGGASFTQSSIQTFMSELYNQSYTKILSTNWKHFNLENEGFKY